MSNLRLTRPLVCFDLESTGTDPEMDRIVEIAVLRIDPAGAREERCRRINPERPIPAEATAVHGIRDEDVHDAPTFRQIAKSLLEFFAGADLTGFNVLRFDVPLLAREFRDCGLDLELDARRVVDVMTIYHMKERRDLSAAVRFYLARDHVRAHAAEMDVAAAYDVLQAQLERYQDLPRTVEELESLCRPRMADAVDRWGKFVWKDGEAVFAFGRHQGRPLREVAGQAPDYLEWILSCDFPADARELVVRALKGEHISQPGLPLASELPGD